jgi:hypothetical protein
MKQQILYPVNAELLEFFSDGRTDALEHLNRLVLERLFGFRSCLL